jgi:transglutaminase-like putative cysteine protease
MTTLQVHHRTRYRYERPVSFGVHRLMLRPRDGHDMRIIDSSLTLSPPAEVRWEFDTFGNSVAFARFHDSAAELVVQSDLVLHRYALDEALVDLAPHAVPYPFDYGDEDQVDLAPLLRLECESERDAVAGWLRAAIPAVPSWSLEALNALNQAIHDGFTYRRRDEEGVQTPGETLAIGSGTCRDFAFFFMEAARQLGFAARFVTGYLYDPGAAGAGEGSDTLSGGGATHAWAETFVPGAGWIEFDPTNSIVAGRNLVRVATTRTPAQAQPVRGTFRGDGIAVLGMDVTVTVRESA